MKYNGQNRCKHLILSEGHCMRNSDCEIDSHDSQIDSIDISWGRRYTMIYEDNTRDSVSGQFVCPKIDVANQL